MKKIGWKAYSYLNSFKRNEVVNQTVVNQTEWDHSVSHCKLIHYFTPKIIYRGVNDSPNI